MNQVAVTTKRKAIVPMLMISILFFVFGFVTWVNAILIPYFKIACELTHFQSYFVAFAFYISYLLMAIPASYLLKRTGFKNGILYGFVAMSIGAFTFIAAALFRQYQIFLLGLFCIGTGLTVLQTAANPYVTILGPQESAAQRISIVGICNKTAGIIAPLLFAAVILRKGDTALFAKITLLADAEKTKVLDELIRRVMIPYAVVGVVLLLLGLMVWLSPLPEIEPENETSSVDVHSAKSSILQFPHLVLGAIAIFVHVGTQVIAVDTVIGYAGSMNVPLTEAKIFPSYILLATITGYIFGICCIPKYISQTTALRICTVLGLTLSILVLVAKGNLSWLGHRTDVSLCFLILLGLPNSLIWAGIWPLALNGLGRFTKTGASLLVMGLCGNAILPLLYGYLADHFGLRFGYWILIPCYMYLIFYAIYGHKIKSWSRQISIAVRTPNQEIFQKSKQI